MTSMNKRNPETDELISPEQVALLVIDYQDTQINSINSMNRDQLIRNEKVLLKLAKLFNIPIILSTVNVATGRNSDTVPPLKEVVSDIKSYDRTSINAWEDQEFYEAVKNTGKKRLLISALWTEACLTFPTLDALKEGYEVYPVVDCVGGTSLIAHDTALRRVEQAGAKPVSLAQLMCELQRDWDRKETIPGFVQLMTEAGDFLRLK